MRNFIIILFVFCGLCSCDQKQSTVFTIEGTIEGNLQDSTLIFLKYLTLNNGVWKEISDTSYLKNNQFYFEGNIEELTAGYLFSDNMDIPIYLEPTKIKLVIDQNDPYSYELSGTDVEKENIELRNKLSDEMKNNFRIRYSMLDLFEQMELCNNDSILADSLMQNIYRIKPELVISRKKINHLQLDFINQNKTYKIVPHLLFMLSGDDLIDNDTILAIYNDLPELSKISSLGKLTLEQIKLVERVKNKKDISIEDTAPDFSRETTQGDTLKLADFRGKSYVLLDFWASWCGPCLKGIPDLKKLYHEIDKEKLTIIGISLDQSREDWLRAINTNQIEMWSHVMSDYAQNNNYFGNEMDLSEIYNINAIPLYTLIDKQGKVVAKWHHIGEEQLIEIDKILGD